MRSSSTSDGVHETLLAAIFLFELYSFYPLYPPVEEVNMDYEKFQSFGQMSVTPDVLILPSELRYFIKVQAAHLYCMRPALFLPTWVFNV